MPSPKDGVSGYATQMAMSPVTYSPPPLGLIPYGAPMLSPLPEHKAMLRNAVAIHSVSSTTLQWPTQKMSLSDPKRSCRALTLMDVSGISMTDTASIMSLDQTIDSLGNMTMSCSGTVKTWGLT